jgi:hypothetical protein
VKIAHWLCSGSWAVCFKGIGTGCGPGTKKNSEDGSSYAKKHLMPGLRAVCGGSCIVS